MQKVNVTDIKVKDGVTAEGARAGQKWQLVIITGDDGSEFTTFDIKAKEVGIGGVIELEPVLKNGKVNFTKFTVISKGTAVSQTSVGTYTNGADSPEKRKSIEDQNRAGHITNLWIAGKILDDDLLIPKLRGWLNQLGSPIPVQHPPAEKKTEDEKETSGTFKNVGEFLSAMSKKGLSRTQTVDELIRLKLIKDEADLPRLDLGIAWEALGDAIIPA